MLPFADFAVGHGWYLKLAEATWFFDLQRGTNIIPIGVDVGRIAKVGNDPALIAISDEATVIRANAPNAPKNTIRLTFTLIMPSRRGATDARP